MRTFGLIFVSVVTGYLWGWASCVIRNHSRKKVDKTLESYVKFQKWRDLQYPEMIGKWGKP